MLQLGSLFMQIISNDFSKKRKEKKTKALAENSIKLKMKILAN